MYPVCVSDDTRSYGTYDKSMDDDLSDDYNKDYEVETWRFDLYIVVLWWRKGEYVCARVSACVRVCVKMTADSVSVCVSEQLFVCEYPCVHEH